MPTPPLLRQNEPETFPHSVRPSSILLPASSYEQIEALTSRLHQTLPSAYVQDDIKLTRRVSVNVGLRWDPITGYNSEDSQLSTFRPGAQSTLFPLASPGLLYPGDAGLPFNIVGSRYDNIAPRLGVAWDVFGNGKTSLRAGAGVYYIPLTRGITFSRFTLIQPFVVDLTVEGSHAGKRLGSHQYCHGAERAAA